MFHLVVKHSAREMLNDAYWWYEEQLPGLGERFLNEIEHSFTKLANAPYSYSLLQENYRQLILKRFPYKIVFEVVEKNVVIYAVFHSKRDPDKLFGLG